MKRRTVVIGTAYAAGMFIASFFSEKSICILMFTAVTIGYIATFFVRPEYCLTAAISFVFAVGLYAVYEVNCYNVLTSYSGSEIVFSGKVSDIEYMGSDMYSLTVRGKLGGCAADISFYTGDVSAGYEDKIILKAKVTEYEDSLKYQGREYSLSEGQVLRGGYAQILSVSKGGFSLRREILRYRDRLFDIITETLPGQEGGFIAAMLCGDKSELNSFVKSDLYRAGIGHIFSVSGMHLMAVSFAVMELLKRTRSNYFVRFALTEAVMLMFVVFAGASASVVRAAIMMSLMNVSLLFHRRYDCLTSILISVMLMTVFSPYAIRSASLLLSAGGAFSFGVAAPKAVRAVRYRGKASALLKGFVMSAAVSVITLPLDLMFFNEISVVAPVTNMLLAPLFTVSLTLAAAVMLTGGISVIARPLLMAAGVTAKILLSAAKFFADLPFSSIALGYTSVRCSALICWTIAAAFIILRNKTDKTSVAAAAVSFLCFVTAGMVNYASSADTLRIYSLSDGGSSMLIAAKGRECVIVNMSGSGELSYAAKRLCDSKDLRCVKGFYDLAESTTAYASAARYFELDGADVCFKESILIDTGGYTVAVNGSGMAADMLISKDGIYDTETDELFAFEDGTAAVIYINEEEYTVRRLDYGFVE